MCMSKNDAKWQQVYCIILLVVLLVLLIMDGCVFLVPYASTAPGIDYRIFQKCPNVGQVYSPDSGKKCSHGINIAENTNRLKATIIMLGCCCALTFVCACLCLVPLMCSGGGNKKKCEPIKPIFMTIAVFQILVSIVILWAGFILRKVAEEFDAPAGMASWFAIGDACAAMGVALFCIIYYCCFGKDGGSKSSGGGGGKPPRSGGGAASTAVPRSYNSTGQAPSPTPVPGTNQQ